MTRTVTAKEADGWLHAVALQIGKGKLAAEASTYAVCFVKGGFGAVEGITGVPVDDWTWAT